MLDKLSWQEQPEDEMDGIGVKYWMEYNDPEFDINQANYRYDKFDSIKEVKYWIREIYHLYEENSCDNNYDKGLAEDEGIQALEEYRKSEDTTHILHLALSFMKTVGWISNSIIDAMIMQEGFTNE